MLLILRCKTMYHYRRIYRVHLPRREREWIEFDNKIWTDSRREKPQMRKTSRVLHCSESDGGWKQYGRHSTRYNKTKNRPIKEYLETPSKIQYFGAVWSSLKRKGLHFYQTRSHAVVLHNTLLAACIEKAVGMKTQDELFQKVRLTPRLPRVVPKIELAMRSTRSTGPRSKIILEPIERFEEIRWNLEQRSWLQNFWSTSFCSQTAGFNKQAQEVDRQVLEPQP